MLALFFLSLYNGSVFVFYLVIITIIHAGTLILLYPCYIQTFSFHKSSHAKVLFSNMWLRSAFVAITSEKIEVTQVRGAIKVCDF